MCTSTGRVKLLLAAYASFICVIHHSCRAQAEHNKDCASSCGNIRNIAYPFRLNTDPKHCGTKKYRLSCENNVLMLYFKPYRGPVDGFQVQAINYNNFTIRLWEPNILLDNCTFSVANRSVSYYPDWFDNYHEWRWSSTSKDYYYLFRRIIFISCPYPMTGSVFEVYDSPCNLRRHWYLNSDSYPFDSDVFHIDNSCRIEAIARTSLLPHNARNISYIDVKNSFAYGFELSWLPACCYASDVSKKYNCRDYLYRCDHHYTMDEMIRDKMTTDFANMFNFLYNIKVAAFFSNMLASLNKTLDGQCFVYNDPDYYHRLTICGLIINFLVAILAILEIKKFTRSFKEKLGEGGYGSVYKGKLRSGRFAAIKMLDKSKADGQDFINEVATIGRIHHVNVVQLIGFCVEGSKRALVYEFMDNGSLDKHIFFKEGCLPMNNKTIFDIALGVAHGIEYLHQGCDMQILHFDIKPHNILLGEKFIPKISDFGLSKLHSTDRSIVSLTATRGTMGYIAPEFFYKNIGGISHKADVYSFGMLLMEMIGRRKNINAFTEHSSRIYFPSWIYDQFNEGKEVKLGDETEERSDMAKKMIIVALWCIQFNPVNRPSMRKVKEMLEGEVEHLKIPPKPFVAPQETPINDAGLNTNTKISSSESSGGPSNSISLRID